MKKHVLIYGITGGVLIAVLNLAEYRYLVLDHSADVYGGLVAIIFAALGIWIGVRLAAKRADAVAMEVVTPADHAVSGNAATAAELGVTPRELEILELIAAGLSTREIAERSFISENTVKTHASRVLGKLGAKRRTQAVQIAKQRGLLS